MPNRLLALKQQRETLLKEAKALVEKDEPTAEEKTQADAILKERLPALDAELTRFQQLHDAERAATPTSSASVTDRRAKDPKRGFANIATFALAVMSACIPGGGGPNQALAAAVQADLEAIAEAGGQAGIQAAPTNYHQEGGTGEGYMVPPAFRDEIWKLIFAEDNIIAAVNPEPTSSNSVGLVIDETTPWGATGIQARWRAEASQMSPSKLATKEIQVKLHELYAFALVTEELLQDAPRLSRRLTEGAAAAIDWKAGEALMFGTGAGQPLGWMNSAALVTQTKEVGQAAATIVAANVAKIFSRNLNPGRGIWWLNQDTLPQFLTMTLGNQPIWTPPANGFQGAPGGFLFGRPIRFSEHNQTLGTKGDIQFVDPLGYYATVRQGGVQFAQSMHLFFDYNMQAFRWTFRLGGQPYLSAAVSPAKGSATKSHFVTLETRS